MENKQPIPKGQTFEDVDVQEYWDLLLNYELTLEARRGAKAKIAAAHEAAKQTAVRAALEGLVQEPHAHTHGYCTLCEAVAHKIKALDQPTGGDDATPNAYGKNHS